MAWLGVGAALVVFWFAFGLGLNRLIALRGATFDVFRVTWEAFLCSSLCIGLVVLFRERVTLHGRLAQALGKSQYAAYIFHVPVILAFQFAVPNVSLPPLAKLALAHWARKPLHL